MGVKEGVDPARLAEAGWGVIFAYEDQDRAPAIKEALGDLLRLRHEQAGEHYREYNGKNAYRPKESKTDFLYRHGVGPGPADPDKVPYYLLIVGDPKAIPYRFQHQLDVQYAVGRIHFETLEEYNHYARSVVAAETNRFRLPRRAVFFGARNVDDAATALSAAHLVAPLAETLAGDQAYWRVESILATEATKARLGTLMGGEDTPALLFTASHGMGFPLGDARQLRHQGAFLCQDWPGPTAWRGAIPETFYFSADDIPEDARLQGLISLNFAAYSAGTPQVDDFALQARAPQTAIAPDAFVGRLPQRLLGHPNGGALAFVGLADRCWSYAFPWKADETRAVWVSILQRLMEGHPAGLACEYFSERYAELSTLLSNELEDIALGKRPDDIELTGMWTANNNARSMVIVGDPAVRLPVVKEGEAPTSRPSF